ncbi:hypothetical protein Sjap_011840 [Stephania japonica]|uniref:RING-type E3 ubiquitin transferase n=1 Tax=Stephania japonica TaxID=461633 RepID=A0AAP0JC95_9MAGN
MGVGHGGAPAAAEPSTSADGTGGRRFPLAAQPEVMRAAEKDDQYASFVYDACRDAFRHLFGTRAAVACQNETKLLGQMLYYILTTGSGQQTLGEEYCDITQVAGSYGLPPTPARRALFILYQTAVPYLAERISSRVAARGIILANSPSEELPGIDTDGRSQVHNSMSAEGPSSSSSSVSLFTLKQKLHRLWLYAVQKWPSILPLAREILQFVLRANLMLFYFEGFYYHISKRAAGIRYVFIGKPLNQRPRAETQQFVLSCKFSASNNTGYPPDISSQSICNRSFLIYCLSFSMFLGRGLPVLNEEGNMITADIDRAAWGSDLPAVSEVLLYLLTHLCGDVISWFSVNQFYVPHGCMLSFMAQGMGGVSKCTLCLSARQHPTATPCGTALWNGAMKSPNVLSVECL